MSIGHRRLRRFPVVLNQLFGVMAGLVPAIHVFPTEGPARKTWMPAKTGSPPRDAAGCHCAGMTARCDSISSEPALAVSIRAVRCGYFAALLILLIAGGAGAQAGLTQAALDDVAVEPRSDATLPLGLRFLDESAQPRTLGEVLAGKPAIVVFADYTCRTLCGPVLTFVAAGLERSGLAAGADYGLVVIGLDPRDDLKSARTAKAARVGSGTPLAAAAVMLTGEEAAIRAATAALGYRYAYDAEHDQFAHPTAAFAVNSAGRVTRVLSGLTLDGANLRMALVEAGDGRVGTLGDRLRVLCYGFDPVRGVYTEKITLWLELAALFTLFGMAIAMVVMNAISRRSAAS